MRPVNNSVETINAAATAIVTAESRVQQAVVQRRRWGSCLSEYCCFGFQRHGKRISHAVLVPEPTLSGPTPAATENPSHPPALVLPFIAPPSSPASFLQSEPPSATQSPAGLISFTALSANVYSPGGPNSMFATGPYAHETQLVSPPVFSTFTTEPSTAPLTPPEPVHLTTPSSPEVPFAQLLSSSLDPNRKSVETCRPFPTYHYEFQSYQLYPGSPVGHLISPSSVISGSGTSSPFPDLEFPPGGCAFPSFHANDPPKLLSIDGLSARKLDLRKDPSPTTLDASNPACQDSLHLESQMSAVASLANSENGSQTDELVLSHRVSFELAAEEVVVDHAGKADAISDKVVAESAPDPTAAVTSRGDHLSGEEQDACDNGSPAETLSRSLKKSSKDEELREQQEQQQQQQQQLSLAAAVAKEFKFDNADGASSGPTVASDWWANEKVLCPEVSGAKKNWTFFPMIQPGVS